MYKKLVERLSRLFGVKLVAVTMKEFFQVNSFFHGAALAYYAIFALVPIFYLAVTYVGMLLGNEVMINVITAAIQEHIGIKDVSGILTFLEGVDFEKSSFIANTIGVIVLLISSTALLNSLRNSINEFYNVKPAYSNRKKLLIQTIISKLVSLILMTGIGLVVIVFYFGETVVLSLSTDWLSEYKTLNWLFANGFRQLATIASNLLIFTFVFKFLHDGKVRWRIAIRGALLTSLLLFLGQILIKYYITNYFFAADGGVPGSILVILIWMFYTSQIIFLGAKFTKVYADLTGEPIVNREF